MKRGLIVSCQTLPDEPLYSSFIMGRMVIAAKQGGAIGIRANSVPDILEIKKQVDLPIIGIIKQEYPNMVPYITPTYKEIDVLVKAEVDIIALDATMNQDESFLKSLKEKYPGQKFMADTSMLEKGLQADHLGFDFIGTTLIGYMEQSKNLDKFEVLKELIAQCKQPVIAEGNFNTPEAAAKAVEMGAYAVVGGSVLLQGRKLSLAGLRML